MKQRFRSFRRGWGTYYCEDTQTGKQESLHTKSKQEAQRLVHARNEAHYQPMINLQIARAYLSAAEPAFLARTWQTVMDKAGESKTGKRTKERWIRGMAERPFDSIRNLKLVETRAEHLTDVMKSGTVSTKIFMRRLHNYALDMNWLLAPIIPKKKWPKIEFGEKRAVTLDEHQKIVKGESNAELRDYYELLWHLGGSQSDIAMLCAEDVDWTDRTISYFRMKNGSGTLTRFGATVARLLQSRPKKGQLFPQLARWKETDRAKAFTRRRKLVGVSGVSLHSYRYAWAERARAAGYPERYAQQALGHRSRAVHNAYSCKAQVKIPPLEDYERALVANNVIQLPVQSVPTICETESAEILGDGSNPSGTAEVK